MVAPYRVGVVGTAGQNCAPFIGASFQNGCMNLRAWIKQISAARAFWLEKGIEPDAAQLGHGGGCGSVVGARWP